MKRALARLRRSKPAPEPDGDATDATDATEAGAGAADPVALGDLGRGEESRRESIARRLGSLRGRSTKASGGIGRRWAEVPKVIRLRIGAGIIMAAIVLVVALVLIPAAPCGAPGGDDCAPVDDAIALVPGDALAYAHLDIDPDSDEYEQAAALTEELPLLTALLVGQIADVGGRPVDFGSQIRPWAGGEAAVALIPGGLALDRVTMIEVEEIEGAEAFAASVVGSSAAIEDVDGIEVSATPGGLATAMLEGFLLVGDIEAIRRIIDPDPDDGKLETAAAATGLEDLPADRVAYAYVSGAGARAILATPGLAPLDTFVGSEASTAVVASLGVEEGVASLTLRSRLDPELSAESPSFFSALPAFEPTLTSDVGADALAYLGVGEPSSSVTALSQRAVTGSPDLAAAFAQAAETLRREGGISVAEDLLPLLGSEAALSVEPVAGAAPGGTPGVLAPAGVPYVTLLADGVDSEGAAASLATLQDAVISALVPPSGEAAGQVSIFEPLQIAGIEAQTLSVSPNVQLTYATYDDRLAIATDPLGIEAARSAGDGLADSETFGKVTADLPDEVSVLAYLDLRDLIALGEQIGLATDPGFAALADDLRALEAAALAVTDDEDEIRTELRLSTGEAAPPQVDAATLPSE